MTDRSQPLAAHSWLIAAPPCWKFATICAVTFLRERVDPLRAHTVIAGKDQSLGAIDHRLFLSLPAGEKHREFFQHAERTGRLGKLQLTFARGLHGRLVHLRKVGQACLECGKARGLQKGGHSCLSDR